MKLCFIANTFRGFGSGKGYWFHKVSELLSKKMEVSVYCWKIKGKKEEGISSLKGNIFKIISIVKRYKGKLVLHFPQYHMAIFSQLFNDKIPIIIGPNIIPLSTPTENIKPNFKERLVKHLKFDKMIAMSNAHKKIIEKYGIPKSKVIIIKPGIELNIFKPIKINRRKYDIKNNDFVFAFINRFAKVKQFEFFEKSMMDILERYNNVKFLIIGKNIEIKHPHIINLGFLPRMKLPHYYNLCDAYINSSKWETYSIANMEALSCGKPCIVTNVGGNPEQIKDGKNGFLIREDCNDLTEKMERLIKNRNLAKKMGMEARRIALKKFDWKPKIKELIQLYKSL